MPAKLVPRPRRRHWLIALTALVAVGVYVGGFRTMQAFALLAPTVAGLQPAGDMLFVDPEMTRQERDRLRAAIAEARHRLEAVFGPLVSSPYFVACSTYDCHWRFGGRHHGPRAQAHGETVIHLSPRGLTLPLIVHEWSHAEVYHRVGGFSGFMRLPSWFNEGLSVVLAAEEFHSEANWQRFQRLGVPRPKLEELQGYRDWNRAVGQYAKHSMPPENLHIVYTVAGHEVRDWVKTAGLRSIVILLEQVRDGADFQESYETLRLTKQND